MIPTTAIGTAARPWYNDASRNFEDPWEAAEFALGGDQLGVYDQDTYGGTVETPQFLHDQIAKGGRGWHG